MYKIYDLTVEIQVQNIAHSVCCIQHHTGSDIIIIIIKPHHSTTYVDAADCYKLSSMVCLSVCHSSEPCKNGWTHQMPFALRTRVGPVNHVLDGGPDPPMQSKGTILRGNGWPTVKYRDCLPWAVQKWLNRLRCHLGYGVWWVQGSTYWIGCTFAPPGKHDWTIHVRWRCSLFVKLLWPLV